MPSLVWSGVNQHKSPYRKEVLHSNKDSFIYFEMVNSWMFEETGVSGETTNLSQALLFLWIQNHSEWNKFLCIKSSKGQSSKFYCKLKLKVNNKKVKSKSSLPTLSLISLFSFCHLPKSAYGLMQHVLYIKQHVCKYYVT